MNVYRKFIATTIFIVSWLLPTIVSAQQEAAPGVMNAEADTEMKAQIARVPVEVSAETRAVLDSFESQPLPASTVAAGRDFRTAQPAKKDKRADGTAVAVSPVQSPWPVIPKVVRANCGPILLQQVLAKHDIHATVEELIEQSHTRLGLTTLYDMKRTVIERGLYAEGIKANSKALAELVKNGDVICHFTQNNHYVWVQSFGKKEIG